MAGRGPAQHLPELHAIAERSEEELRDGLTHLQAAELLYEASLFPDIEYTFKHALTYEVAYQSVLRNRRQTIHARLVEGPKGSTRSPIDPDAAGGATS